MNIYPNEKLVLFIDGPNLHATAKALGFDVDYKKLLVLFRKEGHLIRAIYYTTLLEQQEYSSLRPLVDWLEYNGYSMVTKPAKEFIDATGRRRIKGSMDVELTVHAMQLAPQYDHAILFTGDGDFRPLIASLQQSGKRVSVVSTLESQPPMVADELRRQADQFVDLADLEQQIARDVSERRPVARPHFDDDADERAPAPSAPPARTVTSVPADNMVGPRGSELQAVAAAPRSAVKVVSRSRSRVPSDK